MDCTKTGAFIAAKRKRLGFSQQALAEQLGVQNLILYHTEDKNIVRRKELYTEEGKKYFSGNLYVPEDLEKIEL